MFCCVWRDRKKIAWLKRVSKATAVFI